MTAAGIRPVAPKREALVEHHVAERMRENPDGRARPARCPIESKQVPGILAPVALPHDVVELAHSRIDFGSHAAASRWVVRS
jgi:hypothetical protein